MLSGVEGVLFDFSGTLFHAEGAAASLAAIGVPVEEHAPLVACSDRAYADIDALTGSDAEFARQWARRDLDPASHRAAFVGADVRAGVPADVAERWYDRGTSPVAWRPYPETAAVLRGLRREGVPVAVVSNIGWDPRPVFELAGLRGLVDAYLLSYEQGVVKPDPRLFAAACAAIEVAPGRAVMVGDDVRSDSGALAIGCRFLHVPGDRADDAIMSGLALGGRG